MKHKSMKKLLTSVLTTFMLFSGSLPIYAEDLDDKPTTEVVVEETTAKVEEDASELEVKIEEKDAIERKENNIDTEGTPIELVSEEIKNNSVTSTNTESDQKENSTLEVYKSDNAKEFIAAASTFADNKIAISAKEDISELDIDGKAIKLENTYIIELSENQNKNDAINKLKEKSFTVVEDTSRLVIMGEAEADSIANTDVLKEAERATKADKYLIAVIDTGVNDGLAKASINITNDGNEDKNGHGTKIAREILAAANGNAEIISIKAFNDDGTASLSNILAAVKYATEVNVNAINISASMLDNADTQLVREAIIEAANRGIRVVVAAGNYGDDASKYFPANIEQVYTVGNADANNNPTDNSNRGKIVDYYVKSISTSYAAARLSGYLATGDLNKPDVVSHVNLSGMDLVRPEDYMNIESEEYKKMKIAGCFDEAGCYLDNARNKYLADLGVWMTDIHTAEGTFLCNQKDVRFIPSTYHYAGPEESDNGLLAAWGFETGYDNLERAQRAIWGGPEREAALNDAYEWAGTKLGGSIHATPGFDSTYKTYYPGNEVIFTGTNNDITKYGYYIKSVEVSGGDDIHNTDVKASLSGNDLHIIVDKDAKEMPEFVKVTIDTDLPDEKASFNCDSARFTSDAGGQEMLFAGAVTGNPGKTYDPVIVTLQLGVHGTYEVSKIDSEREINLAQGDASLMNAEFTIYNRRNDRIVKIIKTDELGFAKTGLKELKYGDYLVKETKPSEGYLLNEEWSIEFDIREDGFILDRTDPKNIVEEQVIRGDVLVKKEDLELSKLVGVNASQAIGGKDHEALQSSLLGIEFTIKNISNLSILADGTKLVEYQPQELVKKITTYYDKDLGAYVARTKNGTLPYGTYEIQETKTNEHYLLTDGTPRVFEINEDGVTVTTSKQTHLATVDGEELVFRNQIIRGEFSFNKRLTAGSNRIQSLWVLENTTSGERHVLLTDKNGNYSTTEVEHSKDTNANDFLLDQIDKLGIGDYIELTNLIETNKINKKVGIWFGLGEDGDISAVDNKLGALPKGTYILREVATDTNLGNVLLDSKIFIDENGKFVDGGTYENELHQSYLGIETLATKLNSKEQVVEATSNAKINEYIKIKAHQNKYGKYKVTSMMYFVDSGLPVLDNEVVFEKEININKAETELNFNLTMDFSELAGRSITFKTVLKPLENNDKSIEHNPFLKDAKETIKIVSAPQIEKYINKNVHQTLDEMQQEFTYDVIGYITENAEEVVFTDKLVDILEFANNKVVVSVHDKNNHRVNGTVSEEGTILEEAAYKATQKNGTLLVTIPDAREYRGKWVKVTFDAKIKDAYKTVEELKQKNKWLTIEDDGSVLDGKLPHTGVMNKASYSISVMNNGNLEERYEDIPSNTVTVNPSPRQIVVKKVDPQGKLLENAKLSLIDKETGNVLETWTTVLQEHDISKLVKEGKTYIIREEEGPKGYYLSKDVEFTVEKDTGRDAVYVAEMVDYLINVVVQKVDEKKQFVKDAKLELFEFDTETNEYKSIDKWTTVLQEHDISKLVTAGGRYKLVETEAPNGYFKSVEQVFEVPKYNIKNKIVVEMVDVMQNINFYKYDPITNKAVVGAKYAIFELTKGVTPTSIANKSVQQSKEAGLIKVITEYITINGNQSKDIYGKDIAPQLSEGKTYFVQEISAPFGYELDTVAHSFKMTPIANKAQVIKTFDNPMTLYVKVAKADKNNIKFFLAGAEITVYKNNGAVAKTTDGKAAVGITDNNGEVFFKLAYDQSSTYYVKETKAPRGYLINNDKHEIKVSNDYKFLSTDLITSTILDQAMIIKKINRNTGVNNNVLIMSTAVFAASGLIILLLLKKRKK